MSKELLSDYIFELIPIFHKKLVMKPNFPDLPFLQFRLLKMVKMHPGEQMSYYCEKMMISKPHLTKLSNTLIGDDYLARTHSDEDRRIITLEATDKGTEYITKEVQKVKRMMAEKLSPLSEEDVSGAIDAIIKLKEIFEKLETEGDTDD